MSATTSSTSASAPSPLVGMSGRLKIARRLFHTAHATRRGSGVARTDVSCSRLCGSSRCAWRRIRTYATPHATISAVVAVAQRTRAARGRLPGIHGTMNAATTASSLQPSASASAASVVQSRPRDASNSASAVKSQSPRSTKWLGHESSVRVDSANSGKLAAIAAAGPDHERRSAR